MIRDEVQEAQWLGGCEFALGAFLWQQVGGRGWRQSSEEVASRSLGLDEVRDKVDGTHGGVGRLG